MLTKNIWAKLKNYRTYYPKNKALKKYGIRDTRSGKNTFRILDPGVKKEPDPGSGSTTPVYWKCKKLIWINRDNPAVTKILAVIKLSNECIKDFRNKFLS
jgi:hypothetical protein